MVLRRILKEGLPEVFRFIYGDLTSELAYGHFHLRNLLYEGFVSFHILVLTQFNYLSLICQVSILNINLDIK